MELLESRIYTFVDSTKRFAFYFLEGQQLIQELALIHPLQGGGFAYFRDVVLSFMPMLALLKHGEQLGLYLDAEDPYLRVKLEITAGGHVRCLLMPEDLKPRPIHVAAGKDRHKVGQQVVTGVKEFAPEGPMLPRPHVGTENPVPHRQR